ncbi:MAG: allantoinase AllB [Nitrososphaerota archaeon]|nr:allantoinase AllB [Nitrososphaerota archaeon]
MLLKGGTIVSAEGQYRSDILCKDGVISSIGEGLEGGGAEVVDASGKLVFPGIVDEHVHSRDPGLTYKDDFTNATMGAAAGGTTTIFEMPNTMPPVDSAKIFKEKLEHLRPKAYVDFALYGVLHTTNLANFDEIVDVGAIGFKVFLGPTTGNIPPPDDGTLLKIMEKSASREVTIGFHAENHSIVDMLSEDLKKSGRTDPAAHTDARPPICEEESIRKIAILSKHTGGRAHIFHMCAKEGVYALAQARKERVDISGETCPQYLLLNTDAYSKYGTLAKINPPLRDRTHQEALWRAVQDGTIMTVGSDHAPHSAEEKKGNIWDCAAGFIGVQTLFPLMLDAALQGTTSLESLPKLLAEGPARRFGLYPKKGAVRIGSDADFAVVDPKQTTEIKEKDIHAKYPISPFIGWRLKGSVVYTMLRGKVIMERGSVKGPYGDFVRPRRDVRHG